MQLKLGTAFYWPPAGQRVVVVALVRVERTLITDKALREYLHEAQTPSADAFVLSKQHDEFAAGALITERIESIEVQGVDWVTNWRTIYTLWEIKKEADIGSGDEGSSESAAGIAAEGIEPQHGSESRAGD